MLKIEVSCRHWYNKGAAAYDSSGLEHLPPPLGASSPAVTVTVALRAPPDAVVPRLLAEARETTLLAKRTAVTVTETYTTGTAAATGTGLVVQMHGRFYQNTARL